MLTLEQKLTCCEILGITPATLDAQISFLGDEFTPEIAAAIAAKTIEWTAGAGRVFTSFTATESNKGFNLDSRAAKMQIRRAIALWLDRADWTEDQGGVGRLRRS